MDETRPSQDFDNQQANELCHSREVGLDGFTECSRQGPNDCRYALPFGYAFLCFHPKMQVAERTGAPEEARG